MPAHEDILPALVSIKGCSVEENIPLSGLTTWRVGGAARFVVRVEDRQALREVLGRLRESGTKLFVLGNGSNILVSDAGFDGAVLRLKGDLASIEEDGETMYAGAGAMLGAAVTAAARASLSGLEFAMGIPGTVGGAVMTNAGTFAGSTALVAGEVEALALEGEAVTFTEFSDAYRQALVPPDHVIMGARFKLARSLAAEIKRKMEEVRARRAAQPVGEATAGSVFMNPPGDSAGRLLDECGLKGRSAGAATVSRLHANFIINEGGAKAKDIKELMEEMASEVRDRFDVELQPEVTLVGFEEER